MNPIFLANPSQAATPTGSVDPHSTRNAQRDAHTRQLFLRLRSLDKSESPLDEREAQRLTEEIALFCDCFCTTALKHLFKAGKRPPINNQDLEDLMQEGRLGLVKAIKRFDPSKGVSFMTYAFPIITGEMRHYLRDRLNLIRESSYSQEQRKKDGASAPVIAFCAGLPGQAATGGHECDDDDNGRDQFLLSGIEPDFSVEVDHRLSVDAEINILKSSRDRVAAARGVAVRMHLSGATLNATAQHLGCSISNAKALLTSGLAAMNGALDD